MADSRMTPYNELTPAQRKAMTQAEKVAYLKAARDESNAIAASERAATNPLFDFANRPDAPPPSTLPGNNYIYYYSWIGDTNSGQWKLYRAPNTAENEAVYGSRAIGGPTQAKPGDPVGANALQAQPQPIKDADGNITGWEIPGKGSTSSSTDNTKKVIKTVSNPDGTTTVYYEDGTSKIINGIPFSGNGNNNSTGGNNNNGFTGLKTDAQIEAETKAAEDRAKRQSAYDLLYEKFDSYGLGSLVTPLKDLITSGVSPSEFTLRLRDTDAYKKRFAANAKRVANGLAAIDEADYIGLEDQYQKIMRNYGLPASYYAKGDLGRQEGFENLIANDVSNTELEDRIMTAQQRVLNANPEVLQSIKDFYGDSITNGDILAYALNPTKALTDIKRKVTAAEIGGAAVQAGLNLGKTAEEKALYAARAAELGAAGITKQQAQQGFQTVAEVAPRGGQLAAIYGESPYTQQTAEQEVFGLAGSVEAAKQRKKLKSLEEASFSGRSGVAQGALGRERAGVL